MWNATRRPRKSARPSPYYRRLRGARPQPPVATKTAWDKAGVLIQAISALAIIVPLVALYESVHQFDRQQVDNETAMLDQQRQDTLSTYLDDMSQLVLEYNLPKSKPNDPVRAIAVARTLTAVRDLDGDRKGTLIRYLWEAGLIAAPQPIVNITNANLNGAVFSNADLTGVALLKLGLDNAQFINSQLVKADLSGSALFEAEMMGANLSGSDLTNTEPIGADLAGADLAGADLADSDLTGANLTDATLTGADLAGARYNSKEEYVRNPEGQLVLEGPTQWPRGFNPQARKAVCYTCRAG
jgi:Pentapeptide repeats (8 copies)